MRRLIYKPW